MITGHDVDDRFRCCRKLRKLATPVRQDQRLRHLEAFDPAWIRMQPRGLDDRRPHDRDMDVPADIGHHPLAESLGEGVDVGPAQRAGSLGAGLDELGLDPRRGGGARCRRRWSGIRPAGARARPLCGVSRAAPTYATPPRSAPAWQCRRPLRRRSRCRGRGAPREWRRAGGLPCTRWRCARSAAPCEGPRPRR